MPGAFIALHTGQTVGPEELSPHVRQHLAGFKVPIRKDLPKTASGKFQKFRLCNEL